MKTVQTLLSTLLFVSLITSDIFCQQDHLDVDGHVKIRGRIDINHMDDTTSVIVGRNAGHDNRTGGNNSFFGSSSGLNNTEGFSNSFFGCPY